MIEYVGIGQVNVIAQPKMLVLMPPRTPQPYDSVKKEKAKTKEKIKAKEKAKTTENKMLHHHTQLRLREITGTVDRAKEKASKTVMAERTVGMPRQPLLTPMPRGNPYQALLGILH